MSLTVTFDEIRRHVGRHLGFNRAPSQFSAVQTQDVNDIIDRGLREFYYLRQSDEGGVPYHVWSFLNRPLDIQANANQPNAALPDDFSRLQEGISYIAGTVQAPLGVVKEYEIRNLRAQKAQTGPPKYCAVRAVPGTDQGYELLLYPTPDVNYQLVGRYMIEPGGVPSGDGGGKPLGGALHSETILAACIAAADSTLNPETDANDANSPAGAFARLLRSSIEADKTIDAANAEAGTWPLDSDATDDLHITKRYLRRLIGRHLQYGPSPENWTHGQRSEVAEALRSGLRKFYDPALPGQHYGHQWSFLLPRVDLDLVADTHTYDLPEDFAMLIGPVVYATGDNLLYETIEQIGEYQLEQWLQNQETSYRPSKCAVRVKQEDPIQGGTRWEIIFAPIPDTAYTVRIRYRVNPLGTSTDSALPLGGQPHAQTIIEACLLAADELAGKTGRPLQEQQERFFLRLQTSIGHDQDQHSPDSYGFNRDLSDSRGYRWQEQFMDSHGYDENIVTYNGVEY